MPFLNAKALETDPDGMAFLRAVIRPDFEREEATRRPILDERQPFKLSQPEVPKGPLRPQATPPVPVR